MKYHGKYILAISFPSQHTARHSNAITNIVSPIKISFLLSSAHAFIFSILYLLQKFLDLGTLYDIVLGGSIYTPLLFWNMMGINTLQTNGAALSNPSILGWVLCVSTWIGLYMTAGYLISKYSK
jgi:hypothetical protein